MTEIFKAHAEHEDAREKAAWERMRQLASINIAPHVTKTLAPRDLLPFPWDTPAEEVRRISAEEQRKRFEYLRDKMARKNQITE